MSGKIRSDLVDEEQKTKSWVKTFFSDEVIKYLRLTHNELVQLSPVECATIGYLLSSQSFFVQKEINTNKALAKEILHNIDKIIEPELRQLSQYIPKDERRLFAITSDGAAKNLHDLLIDTQKKIEALDFLSNRLDQMSRAMIELKRAKYEPSTHS